MIVRVKMSNVKDRTKSGDHSAYLYMGALLDGLWWLA
jgi:hypothetical protein